MSEKFYIAGFKFHEGMLKISKGTIAEGDVVTLVPEPTNPYDENAIQVHHDGTMIGFVPKAVNKNLLPLFNDAASVEAEILKVNEDSAFDEPWKAVQVLVEEKENGED